MLRHWLGRPKAPRLHARTGQAPLRVLHVGKFYPPYRGGMESFLADLIEQQRASGIDAYAVVHGDPLPDDPPWLIRVPVQITLVFAPIALGFPLALWLSWLLMYGGLLPKYVPVRDQVAMWLAVLLWCLALCASFMAQSRRQCLVAFGLANLLAFAAWWVLQ